jgi:hypothetical protein
LSGSGYSGINIVSTNGYDTIVQNSVTSGNGKNGIYANVGIGQKIIIKKTFFMGNNRVIYTDSDPNIAYVGTLLIIP